MATTHELSLLSLTHLHTNLTQQQQQQSQPNKNHQNQDHNHQDIQEGYQLLNPSPSASWMWNPKFDKDHHNYHHHHHPPPEQEITAPAAAEEESWEVRAFAEDTGSVMGTTWPPRSYTCAFCRREFRSAQALGGHMNVHRRDRARLHQVVVGPTIAPPASSSNYGGPSSFLSTTGPSGFCLLYPPPAQPSTLLSIYGSEELDVHRQDRRQIRTDEQSIEPEEELDLELRLGQGPTPS